MTAITRAQEKESLEARQKSLRSADPKKKKNAKTGSASTGGSKRAALTKPTSKSAGKVSKKQGRPRATVQRVVKVKESEVMADLPVKRGRGRPKKAPLQTTVPQKKDESPERTKELSQVQSPRRSPRKIATPSPKKADQPIEA